MNLEPPLLRHEAAIVTGASSGLGRIMALALAEAGCSVLAAARRVKALDSLAAESTGHPGRIVVEQCDIRTRGHGQRLVAQALEEFGRLDGVVLNAGTASIGPAEREDLDTFAEVLAVNVTAQVELAGAVAQTMLASGEGGWMIALSSILGRRAGTGGGVAAYTASKGAIEQLVRELARQWAPHGIRVNGLAPGFFPTAMNAPMVADADRLAAMIGRIPLGRAGDPDDLAGPLLFLASPAARYVTGHTLAVDGGMACW